MHHMPDQIIDDDTDMTQLSQDIAIGGLRIGRIGGILSQLIVVLTHTIDMFAVRTHHQVNGASVWADKVPIQPRSSTYTTKYRRHMPPMFIITLLNYPLPAFVRAGAYERR